MVSCSTIKTDPIIIYTFYRYHNNRICSGFYTNFNHNVFVTGALIQISEKSRGARSRLSATFGGKSAGGDKETSRQCFLFSNHLILATRQSDDDGRLNLVPQIGKIALCDATLIEDPSDQNTTDDDGVCCTNLRILIV